MFKKIAFFALFLAVTGLFAATSVNAQRLVKGSLVKSTDTLLEPIPEANPAVNLDQCQNGGVGQPVVSCAPGWANGNSNGNNSHYAEGTNIHYRARFSNLIVGTVYTVTLEYDMTHQTEDQNAIDYLNTYNASGGPGSAPVAAYSVIPCDGIQTGCSAPPSPSTFPMADDACHTFDDGGARDWTGWGMTITGTALGANCTGQLKLVTVTFTADTTSPVLAWSGHIARAVDWNTVGETSASSIQGSPYHMRIAGNTGWGGQQDRSLATSAVTTPSAAGANISGRVTDAYGRAISSARITLNNASTGEVEVVYTNTFGYYTFKDVPVGDFFVMTAQHSRYRFVSGSVSFQLEDNIAGLDFKASR